MQAAHPLSISRSLFALTFPELEAALEVMGINPFHAAAIWRMLYRDPAGSGASENGRLPDRVNDWVREAISSEYRAECSVDTASSDGLTRKFLLRMADGQTVETVLMGYPGRYTACVSTQAGCAMGCVFCATGQMGFVRHLEPAEIVGQVRHAQCALGPAEKGQASPLRNLVLMGMGEPLHNYDAVMQALEIIGDTRGINVGPSRVTISTVGVIPGILRLADERRPYHLAVSLHAATQEARAVLVPSARKWPLDELMDACRYYCRETGRRIFLEWTLVAGKNDTLEQAAAVTALLSGLNAHLNLIPLNPTKGFAGEATLTPAVKVFHAAVQAAGIPCTIRQRRGIDVAAGCGQLRAEKEQKQGMLADAKGL